MIFCGFPPAAILPTQRFFFSSEFYYPAIFRNQSDVSSSGLSCDYVFVLTQFTALN
jgi:hypothetical protein